MKKTITKQETINRHYLNLIKSIPGDPDYQKTFDKERNLALKIFNYAGKLKVDAIGNGIWFLDDEQVESVCIEALTEFSDAEHIEEHIKSLMDGLYKTEFMEKICEKGEMRCV